MRIFYGWVVTAVAFLSLAMMRGSDSAFAVFFVAMLEEFKWKRASLATTYSLSMLIYAVSSPLTGRLIDRLGARLVLPAGAVLLAGGLAASSQVSSLGQYYLYYGLMVGLGVSLLGFVSHVAILTNWFQRWRASAIGAASAGMGVGALVLVPLAQILIERLGWRNALLVMAGLVITLLVPLNLLFQRQQPADLGLFPDGDTHPHHLPDDPPGDDQHRSGADQTGLIVASHGILSRAMQSRQFWVIALGHFCLAFSMRVMTVHQVAYLVDLGFAKMTAATILGVTALLSALGGMPWGYLSDRLGRRHVYLLSLIPVLAGMTLLIALTHNRSLWLLYASAALYGLGTGASIPTYGALIGDIFQGKNFGLTLGLLEVSFGVGGAVGPWVAGYLFDLWENYLSAFLLVMVGYAASGAAVWLTASGPSAGKDQSSQSLLRAKGEGGPRGESDQRQPGDPKGTGDFNEGGATR